MSSSSSAKAASKPFFDKVALIGIGLIGSSIAQALRAHKLAGHIVCADTNPKHLGQALELDIVDAAFVDAAFAVQGADLVILATPVGAFEFVAERIAPHLKEGCLVTDVGSVKESIVHDVAPLFPAHVSYVPGHPIAGAAAAGPEAGYSEMFEGRWWLLTPVAPLAPDVEEKITSLWEACGAKVAIMDPARHDFVMATVSHLPQLLSYVLMASARDLEERRDMAIACFGAGGFRDMTRLAESDPVMWRDIYVTNKEAVLDVLDQYAENLAALREMIAQSDAETMESFFTRAQKIKKEMAPIA